MERCPFSLQQIQFNLFNPCIMLDHNAIYYTHWINNCRYICLDRVLPQNVKTSRYQDSFYSICESITPFVIKVHLAVEDGHKHGAAFHVLHSAFRCIYRTVRRGITKTHRKHTKAHHKHPKKKHSDFNKASKLFPNQLSSLLVGFLESVLCYMRHRYLKLALRQLLSGFPSQP